MKVKYKFKKQDLSVWSNKNNGFFICTLWNHEIAKWQINKILSINFPWLHINEVHFLVRTVFVFFGRAGSTEVVLGHLLGLSGLLKLSQDSLSIPTGWRIHLKHLQNHNKNN